MLSNAHPMGAMNIRGLTLGLLIVTAMLAISVFAISQVLAQTPPVVTAPADITVEAESADGTPATNAVIEAFLQGATAVHEEEVSFPVTAVGLPEVFPLGTTAVTFSATDAASNIGTAQATVTVLDATPPALIGPADLTVEADSQGGANVVLPEATASDLVDPAPLVSCTPLSGFFTQGATLVSCTAIDASGNTSSGSFTVTVVDTSTLSITATVEPPPNAVGWNNADVTVTFTCAEGGSGIVTCPVSQTVTEEGANQIVEGTATDLEGNTATAPVNINLDKTMPTVTITSPAQDAVFLSTNNVLAVWGAADALSGVASSSGTVEPDLPIDTSTQGMNSFSVTASDLAGNSTMITHSYSVVIPFALFEVENGSLELEQGAATDDFELVGRLESADTSNGIDVPNENVTVTFDGFVETIPAGSFVRNSDGDGFEFIGVAGGITQFLIKDDGSFRVNGEGLDLGSIVATDPVFFSLRIGDDVGETNILFGVEAFDLKEREAKDLFGTVFSITVLLNRQGVLVINTKGGFVDVLTGVETEFRLPRNRDASIEDLVAGDLAAVSLEEEDGVLVAVKVFVVPGKTQYRHVPGTIVSLIVGEQFTIQRPGAAAEQVTFNITDETKINLRGNVDELSEGLFVVVSAVRDVSTGNIAMNALEINVTRGRPPIGGPKPPQAAKSQSKNTAEIQGVLGLDALGNWTLNGIVVAIDPDAVIEEGLVVGQTVKIEGVLQEDGTILALEVKIEDEDDVVSSKMELRGIFQGIDQATGSWIISGILVGVGPGTDTDGLPFIGQSVKVEALLQGDGALLAREIENKGGSADGDNGTSEVNLAGTFLGVDADGKWIIDGGASVLIDPLTQVKGSPEVGERIKIKAVLQEDGSLLAVKIEGKGRSNSRSRNNAEIRGTVEQILADGTLVVDGVPISLSVLTDLDLDPEIGDSVNVEASFQSDGSLIAIEVEREKESGTEGGSEPRKVEIEGTIGTINLDGSLIVNGMTVSIDADAEIKGNLVVGAEVKLEGFLQEDGTVLALELKARGRQAAASGTERKIEGLVEDIMRDQDGNIVAIIVDGETISVEALTRFEGLLEVGASVKVKGLEINGRFVANKVEGEEDSGRSKAEAAREKGQARAEEAQEKGQAKAEEAQEKGQAKAEAAREKGQARAGSSGRGSDGDSEDGDDG